jgi:hypothetical protein
LLKLRAQQVDLDRRRAAEFKRLGQKVWQLHADDALTAENLAGAFDALEALAAEAARIEKERASLQGAPPAEPRGEPEAERRTEPPAGPTGQD